MYGEGQRKLFKVYSFIVQRREHIATDDGIGVRILLELSANLWFVISITPKRRNVLLQRYNIDHYWCCDALCRYGIKAITSAFQADDVGSIPTTCLRLKLVLE